jgi:UDP-N-acetylglucosamine acyltransferase
MMKLNLPTFDETDGMVQVGTGNTFGPGVILYGPLIIGDDNEFHAFSVIGDSPEHKGKVGAGVTRIGSRNVFREHTIVHRSVLEKGTQIGDDNYFMHGSHIAHDCMVYSSVRLSPYAVLGGHSIVMDHCTLGISAITHQYSVIGTGSMIGMGAVVTKDVPPFSMVYGNPAKNQRVNQYQIELFNGDFREEHIKFQKLNQGRKQMYESQA